MTATFSTFSVEYVRVPVSATEDGTTVDPTADIVAIAVVPVGDNPTGSFQSAEWETANGAHYARALIGPGTDIGTLLPGVYDVWVRITDNPETPAKRAGHIKIH